MQTVEDISYGVIPVKEDSGVLSVFLINQFGFKGDLYWTFPKGHPEPNETPEESALRELREETGIIEVSLSDSKTYTQTYSFKHEDTLVSKTVVYFVGNVSSDTFAVQEDEVKEAGWFSSKDAYARLTYEHAKEMFLQVLQDLGYPLST